MKNKDKILKTKSTTTFHTGVATAIDRKIGVLGLLTNSQIFTEKSKLKNMRNGKVRS
ncbi:hypothetical protein J4771_03260 [Candidatus Kaistella beijingensis]|uniref:hypothetical protein n=1 Tax=Candidatus Kaistella beijingensis TaxID=2820270 RepID=UPI001CC34D78|nr:hypothetical protein [Candidatus Kaistella beijingensis]UBB90388.1 hypothetical protein J4771_03260 [Candidatus Kaistella beijingensis]